jgi:glycosyltransferase involved in cell wall biosynthesis
MRIAFDCRVLTHKTYTGVENYAKNILEILKESRFRIKSGMTTGWSGMTTGWSGMTTGWSGMTTGWSGMTTGWSGMTTGWSEMTEIEIAKPKTTNKYLSHLWAHFILPFKSADVLFCPANIAPFFVPKRKKLVVTIHDVAFLTYPKSFSSFFRSYYRLLMPLIIKRADKIITVSEYSKNEIEKYYPIAKAKIEVIYLGCDKSFKKIDSIKKNNQILYVGSMNSRKNFVGVLKAFERLSQKDQKLVMVGNFSSNFAVDTETQKLLKQTRANENIEFKNRVSNEELVKIYNESKLFVFPSFYEGFGLPVLEAMACGTPVICSDTSSLPEVGGDAVVYCNPLNEEDIKEKIEMVLADEVLQQKMATEGLERAQLFSWEKSAKEHLEVFQKVFEK